MTEIFNFSIGLNAKLFEESNERFDEVVSFSSSPHLLISGGSGSGKTYASIGILARICKYYENTKLIICDYKGDDDFEFLNGLDYSFRFDKCTTGLNQAYIHLINRQQQLESKERIIVLFFDEYNSYINSLDKKEGEVEKQKLSQLLNMGRSFNIFVIVAVQRADAEIFSKSRDNFANKLGLGALSKESISMLFSSVDENIEPQKQGQGYLLKNGTDFIRVIIPKMHNINNAKEYIYNHMKRSEQDDLQASTSVSEEKSDCDDRLSNECDSTKGD